MNTTITHSASTITTFPRWQGVSIPRISSRYSLQSKWRRSGVFIYDFEHIPHHVLVFLLLTLSRQMQAGCKINVSVRLFDT